MRPIVASAKPPQRKQLRRIHSHHRIAIHVQILVQALGIGHVAREEIEAVEGAGREVVPFRSQVLELQLRIVELAAVKEARQRRRR